MIVILIAALLQKPGFVSPALLHSTQHGDFKFAWPLVSADHWSQEKAIPQTCLCEIRIEKIRT